LSDRQPKTENIITKLTALRDSNNLAELKSRILESYRRIDAVNNLIKSYDAEVRARRKRELEEERLRLDAEAAAEKAKKAAEAPPEKEEIITAPPPEPVAEIPVMPETITPAETKAEEKPSPKPAKSAKPEKSKENTILPTKESKPKQKPEDKAPRPESKPVKQEARPAPAVTPAEPEPVLQKRVYVPKPVQTYTPPPRPQKPGESPNIRTRQFSNDTTGAGARRPYPPRPGAGPYPPRPAGTFPRPGAPAFTAPPPTSSNAAAKKKTDHKDGRPEDRKTMSKRTLVRRGFITENTDDRGFRKVRRKSRDEAVQELNKVTKAVVTTENMTVKMLSELIGVTAQEIIKQLMNLGVIVNINSVVDFDNMALICIELGVELELKLAQTKEEKLVESHDETEDKAENLIVRPPIVTVMGHVDHGKTSLLDALRHTDVAGGEAGGITQHIGAYSVSLKGKNITFIDTPGHEAFTAMRARGAQVTDIVIIVVAADDGIMPQTVEAINHAKAANVPIVVAVNKMDKPAANPDRVKQQLTEYNVLPEEWGGDTPVVPVSAKTGAGLEALLENILILAEIRELKANPLRKARGTVVEAKLDKGKGPVATVIVQNGTLKVGDMIVSGLAYGHIRAMTDDKGKSVREAGPSMAVSVLGFQDVPSAGDGIFVVSDEKLAKQVAEERSNKQKIGQLKIAQKISLDDVFTKISEGQIKDLNLIVKADVQGSVEAIKASLIKLSNNEVKVCIIHGGVGAVNKSDLMLAEASHAIIIGFNVRPDAETKQLAEASKIDIRLYRIIYDALDDVAAAIKGMLAPKFKEVILGHAEVRNVFKITNTGIVAGCYITDGKVTRSASVRVYRDNVLAFDGNVDSLKRFKDDVKEVVQGFECGITITKYSDISIGDIFEAYILEKVE